MNQYKGIRKGLFIGLASLMLLSLGAGINNIQVNAKHRHTHVTRVARHHARKHAVSIRSINRRINSIYKRIRFAKRHHHSTRALYREVRALRKARASINNKKFMNSHKNVYWLYKNGKHLNKYMPNTNVMYRKAYDDVQQNNYRLEPAYAHNKNYRNGWIITYTLNVSANSIESPSKKQIINAYLNTIDLYNQGIIYAKEHNNKNIQESNNIWSVPQTY